MSTASGANRAGRRTWASTAWASISRHRRPTGRAGAISTGRCSSSPANSARSSCWSASRAELRRDRRGAGDPRGHGDVAAGARARPAAHAHGLRGRRQGRSCSAAEGQMIPERRISEAELHAYVDGELTPQDRAEVEAMLAAAPAEAGLVRDFRDLNAAIGQRYAGRLEEPVPGRMQQALVRIPEHTNPKRPGLVRRLAPLAAAILIAAMAGVGGYLARGLTIDTR